MPIWSVLNSNGNGISLMFSHAQTVWLSVSLCLSLSVCLSLSLCLGIEHQHNLYRILPSPPFPPPHTPPPPPPPPPPLHPLHLFLSNSLPLKTSRQRFKSSQSRSISDTRHSIFDLADTEHVPLYGVALSHCPCRLKLRKKLIQRRS